MKLELKNAWHSLVKLFRFLFWYAAAVAVLFYLAPIAGLFLQGQYEAMSGVAKFAAVLGFFVVVGAWQILSQRDRLRMLMPAQNRQGQDGAS